ncbi:aspartate aminotransferase family protein [Zooshikella harenae]|uniref:Acetylornithine aminotransferase n=1 Tax=Zooshikella harenae TaxID=2827238 RepID=A0ABS5ZDV8_9GAMM|nr:aspartate aminotransferase family protein [Zooshikella harenae]MBU2712175.1 aspartate aminotransferase family protein [Zooshikella harenae]
MTEKQVTREVFDAVMVPNYNPQKIIPVRGEGSRIWDQSGKEYIDFAGGIAVTALGHCHPRLVNALSQQAKTLWHLSNVYTNEPVLKLAQKLTELTFADKVFFANSGAEANEAAFKLVRKYSYDHVGPEKNEIISFTQSFHGRTLFTVSVGGQTKYRKGFEPAPGGIRHAEFNDLASVEAVISDKTCAVVLEPIQGEGGIIPAHPDFLRGVRELCDKHQALLVFDEVQTGVGRTGHLYAYMEYDVVPDILTSAKALGCGFPIGAMLTTDKVAKSLVFGTHGSTSGGNPLACAVANEVIDIIKEPALLKGVHEKNQRIIEGLNAINAKYGIFKEVRGKGLLIGGALKDEWQGQAGRFLQAGLAEGVMVLVAGPNVIRMAPSLIIPDSDIDQGLALLEKGIAKVVAEGPNT